MHYQRIELLDFIRGVAVLGILLMNIRLFSEPYAAYFSPLTSLDQTTFGRWWWIFQAIFADQKFMAMFSMMFGASTAMICDNLIKQGKSPYRYYAQRLLILLLIGLIHAYLIWHGDILVFYAICGFAPLILLRFSWHVPLILGTLSLMLGSLKSYETYLSLASLPSEVIDNIIQSSFSHSVQANSNEILAFQGTWIEQLNMRIKLAHHFHADTFLAWGIYRVTGLMLIGLAVYRLGFITGRCRKFTYVTVGIFSLAVGCTMSAIGLVLNEQEGWVFPNFFFKNNLWNYWGSVLVAIGYIAMLTLISQLNVLTKLEHYIQSIGRTALTNYLFQSLICTSLYYGLNMYAQKTSKTAILIVMSVWLSQLVLSNFWLKYYRMGPVEWLWRILSGRNKIKSQ